MNLARITGLLVGLYVLLFAGLGLGAWVAPDAVGARLGVAALGPLGLSTLRGDLGGLFLGLAVLAGVGLARRGRLAILAAAAVLALVVAGRLIGLAADGGPRTVAGPLAIEVAGLAVLLLHARLLGDAGQPRTRGGLVAALAIGALIVAAAAALLLVPRAQDAVMDRVAARIVGRDTSALMADDALRIAVCGSSAPLPSARRAKACVAVIAGGRIYIVDVGPESVKNLMRWGLPLSRVSGVLLTHFHSDHIGDLGELNLQTWAAGRPAPLPVYGGPGVERVVAGFDEAYALDQGYRTAHHGPRVMPPTAWPLVPRLVPLQGPATSAKSRTAVALDDGALKVTAIEVDHGPIEPAYAYRFDYKGRSVVITGDTKAHPPLAVAARGADVLVSEAISRPMVLSLERNARAVRRQGVTAIMHDIQDYHVSPVEAAEMANAAGVKLLVFYHLLPAPDNPIARRMFTRGVGAARHGDWTLSDDGSLYTLPLGSTDVRIGRMPR